MLNRRVFLCTTMALAALVQGCKPSADGPSASGTWRGKWIDIYGADGLELDYGAHEAKVVAGEYRIVIRETSITLNGDTKAVQPFSRVAIHVKPTSVLIAVDGVPLFT
jgi:hypothetical protein